MTTAASPRRVAVPELLRQPPARPLHGRVRALSGITMGTSWSVKFVGSDATAATLQRIIPSALDRVVAQMSPWESDADISRFNRLPPGEWQQLPPETVRVMQCALQIAGESSGAYDPTLGALVDLWGFGPRGGRSAPPAAAEVTSLHHPDGWRRLELDAVARRLRRQGPTGPIDLCGIAKGFAVDLVMEALHEQGVHHALVEIGGELLGRGIKPDGNPWWVELDRPAGSRPAEAPLLVALHDLAIATSGRERSFASGGRHYSHTLNPRTGYPIANGMVTATVLHGSCMAADAYATALMVLGPEAGLAFATRHELAALILFEDEDGAVLREQTTPQLDAMLA